MYYMPEKICNSNIPPEIQQAVELAAGYMKNETDDWVTIKRMLLLVLPSKYRSLFSTRDPHTKEQRVNDFERNVINLWQELTGVELVLVSDRRGKGRQ